MEDGGVPEKPHIEETAQTQVRTPNPAGDGPAGARQIVRRPAPAHFHDRDFVSFFHQPEGRNAAAETGTDNNEIEIELAVRRAADSVATSAHLVIVLFTT
jgi:hypothetical protein